MLAQTIRGITECVSVTDVNDNILFVNRAFEETYGYSAEELIGKPISIVRSSKTEKEVGREILPGTLAGGWKGEIWNKKKDGTEFPISLSTSAVRDAQGKVTALVGIAQDITKTKQAEEQINLLMQSIYAAANSIVITDRNGTIISVNPAFCKVSGYSFEEASGNSPRILKSGKQSPAYYKILWETILSGNVWKGEVINKRKDGTEYMEDMTITPVKNSAGEISHFIAIKEDITERKNLQNQLNQIQKMESIGTLASGIAHDFNNILGIILAHSGLLSRGVSDPKRFSDSVAAITNAVQRGASLVKQILTFARKTETKRTLVNVNSAIGEIVKMLGETFPKTIVLSIQLDENIPTVMMDATQLHQALLNLCVNARDAMNGKGTIQIQTTVTLGDNIISSAAVDKQQKFVCISITDSGTGMSDEVKRRIFDPFFTTKEIGKGTGLGLAVVYGVMQSHGGAIDVESEVGVGTTFKLYFPISQTAVSESTELGVKKEIKGGTETILVVEDEEQLMKILTLYLETSGYTLITARDGMEALETYKTYKDRIKLVLTDLGLPKLSGVELITKLKHLDSKVKIIMASGFLDPDARSEMFKLGVKEFVQKPYTANEILIKIREILDVKVE